MMKNIPARSIEYRPETLVYIGPSKMNSSLNRYGSNDTKKSYTMLRSTRNGVSDGRMDETEEYTRQTLISIRKLKAYSPR